MARKVVGIHLVCRDGYNVTELGDGWFKSGNWRVGEEAARTAQYIALHETKNSPSYKQGEIKSHERCADDPKRLIFYAKETDESLDWVGGGTGER